MISKVVEELAYRDRERVFKDRLHAGELLAKRLDDLISGLDAQLLAIPAGGVPVAHAVAQKLKIPLDVAVVRKIQIPWDTEAGFGAVTWDGRVLMNEVLAAQLGLSTEVVDRCISRTRQIVHQREREFRGTKPFPKLNGKTVVLVDDGLASGFTMLAAAESVRTQHPEKIVVAVPTGSVSALELLARNLDELLCLNIRSGPIFAVADAYEKWYDLSDDEVLKFLGRTWEESV